MRPLTPEERGIVDNFLNTDEKKHNNKPLKKKKFSQIIKEKFRDKNLK